MAEKVEQLVQIDTTMMSSPVFPPRCDCNNNLEIKLRKFGGGDHYVYQCNLCGEQRGGSLKKAEAIKLLNGNSVRDFDPTIEEKRGAKNKLQIEKLYSRDQQESFLDEEQRRINEDKIKLGSDIERFILKNGREQSLALLTARVVALRKEINEERKKTVDRFKNERELKTWFKNKFNADFYIYAEVPGVHVAENKDVLIDYILIPKEHLVQEGFEPCHFGVEVKYFKQESEFTHKTSRGLWQTISYNDCDFIIDNSKVRLKFGLIFSNLSFAE